MLKKFNQRDNCNEVDLYLFNKIFIIHTDTYTVYKIKSIYLSIYIINPF